MFYSSRAPPSRLLLLLCCLISSRLSLPHPHCSLPRPPRLPLDIPSFRAGPTTKLTTLGETARSWGRADVAASVSFAPLSLFLSLVVSRGLRVPVRASSRGRRSSGSGSSSCCCCLWFCFSLLWPITSHSSEGAYLCEPANCASEQTSHRSRAEAGSS